MTFKQIFEKIIETKENHQEKNLKTHYYSHNYLQIKEALLSLAPSMNYEIKHVNDQHKEIILEHQNHYVIATIMEVKPYETALDLKVGMYTILGLNRPRIIVKKIYDGLAKNISFKGVGLYK